MPESQRNEAQHPLYGNQESEVRWFPSRFLVRALCWVPKAVHYAVLVIPLLIIFALNDFFGLRVAIICCTGAAIHLYTHVLSYVYLTPRVTKDGPTIKKKNKENKKRIAVIGAGPSGLVTAKELLEHGHEVQCFDRTSQVGGVFANKFWHAGQLTSSPYVTCFSDFEPERDAKTNELKHRHWFKEEYCTYLEQYANHFGVTTSCLNLGEKVVKVTQLRGSGMGKPVFYMRLEHEETGNTREVGPFDHVAICSGSFDGEPNIPHIPGLDKYPGNILHSTDFNDISAFKAVSGKRIVTVGLGESMADLLGAMFDLPTPPSACSASARAGAFTIPRVNALNNQNNDFDSTRLRYALPKAIHNATIVICTYLTALLSWAPCASSRARFEMFRRIPGAAPAYRPASKSGAWVSAAAGGKLALKPGICKIDGRDVHFEDGSIMKDVDVIAFGTGFLQRDFPFFTDASFGGGREKPTNVPTERFLRMFDPNHGSSIAFIGIGIRPLVGTIPTVAEMQARLFAKVVSGERELPSSEEMVQLACKAAEADRKENAKYYDGWKFTLNWIPYMDTLAKEIGCLPRSSWMILRPRLALKLLIGPMTPFHYRLIGPGAKRAQAEDVIRRLPFGTRVADVLFFTSIHATVALLRWPWFFAGLVLRVPFTTSSRIHRPTLLRDPNAENEIKVDPEGALRFYNGLYGAAIRFNSAGGKSTVALLNQDLVNKALETREISFEEASYQSKVRFGLRAVVKDRAGVAKISKFFHKFMTGKRVVSEFEISMSGALNRRLVKVVEEECTGNDGLATISLQSLVGRVVFAANVQSIFGENIYTPSFYEDYLLFSKSIGYRSASGASQEQSETEVKIMEDAKSRLLQKLRTARKSTSSSPLIQKIQSNLDTDESHADLMALMLLWGSNVNLLSSSMWLVADLLKDQVSLASLRRERAKAMSMNGNHTSIDLSHQSRPLLSAVVAEGLRLRTRPNLYRVAVADCTLKTKEEAIHIRSGEWIWMFPRVYLHHNPEFYPQPTEFHPFERFGNPSQLNTAVCPFRRQPTKPPSVAQRLSSLAGIGSAESTNSRSSLLRQSITQTSYRKLFEFFSMEDETEDENDASTSTTMTAALENDSSTSVTMTGTVDLPGSGTKLRILERQASTRSSTLFRLLGPSEMRKDEATATNPFLAGNQHLRAFGGGTAPCPGKDYAVTMLKVFVDSLLLSDLHVSLVSDEELPLAVTETVSSTPAPSKDIMVQLHNLRDGWQSCPKSRN